MRTRNSRYVLPVELRIVRKLRQQGEDDEADAVSRSQSAHDAGEQCYSHGSEDTFREVVEPWQEEERREQDEGRGNK